MKAIIEFTHPNTGEEHRFFIELFDNPYVRHVVGLERKSKNWSCSRVRIPSVKRYSKKTVDCLWKQLLEQYNSFLSIFDLQDQFNIPTNFDRTNKYTNILHRVFTEYVEYKTYNKKKVKISNQAMLYAEEMNETIHELEKYISNKTRKNFEYVNWIEIQAQTNPSLIYRFSEEEKTNMVSQDCSVYGVKHILGKDYIISYLDEDNPDEWDIQNMHIGFCGFCIDAKGDLRRQWKDKKFVEYLNQNKVGYYPMGNMAEKELKELYSIMEVCWPFEVKVRYE
jgi:hypothetical protein